jgi:predicted acylesterase/phospholipase RssA
MFREVFVEGHGASTAMALGAIAALSRAGLLAPNRTTTCYSMASVMAVAMALGRRPRYLLRVACESRLLRLGRATLVLCAAFRSVRVWLTRRLCRLLSLCGIPRAMTMRELHERTGHDIRVLVASLSRGRTYVVHAANAATANVRHVLLASCCIPGVLEFDGDLVDGGTFGGFADADACVATRGALVLATDVGAVSGPTLVVAYKVLLHKLLRAWSERARKAGATVLVMRAGARGSMDRDRPERVARQYAHGVASTTRLISSCVFARSSSFPARGRARIAATSSAALGGDEQIRSSLDPLVSRAASASRASISASRLIGV